MYRPAHRNRVQAGRYHFEVETKIENFAPVTEVRSHERGEGRLPG